MRNQTKLIALFLFFLACTAASAADFANGLDALDRGDYGAALKELRPLAEAGNARAQYRLGTMFAMGLGVPQDYRQAANWLNKAATQGNAHAQNELGVLYDVGRGVPADPRQAARWFRKAAERGIGAAQFNLASLYQQGRGVPLDPVEAFAWADAATQLGDLPAQKLLDAVAKKGELGLAELHGILFVEKSTTTRLVNPLIQKGLLTRGRAAHDSRAARLALTEEGRETHRKVRLCLAGFFENITRHLPGERRKEVLESVRIFIGAIRKAAGDCQCCE